MSEQRNREAEIQALQNRVAAFWEKYYGKLHAMHVQSADALRQVFINDAGDEPGTSRRRQC